jgi:preprotein translocase subunit YajC
MHPRSSSRRFAGACAALLALALLGTHAAAAKTATGGHPARVAGTVSAVNAPAGTLTITPRRAAAVTLSTNGQTRLSLDGEPAKLADIPAGATARALYDSATKLALRIQVRSQPALAAVAGKVTAVTASSLTIAPEEGSPVTLGTDASTKIVLDGMSSTLSAIAVADQARALYDSTTLVAAAIAAESPHHGIAEIEGQVTAVTASSLTIAPDTGSPVTLGTKASTVVILDGAPSALSAIVVGDQARALYDSTTLIAAAIEAESPHHELAEIEGQVTAVTASSLTIAPEEGAPVTVGTDASTVVILDGAPSMLSAIAVGDKARALYDSTTLIAVAIQAQSPHHELREVAGQVTAVGGASISITPDDPQGAAAVTLGTSSTTLIFLDGGVSNLSSIAVGDRARALYDSATLIAIAIAAESPSGH